jgi:hypothetical protein
MTRWPIPAQISSGSSLVTPSYQSQNSAYGKLSIMCKISGFHGGDHEECRPL